MSKKNDKKFKLKKKEIALIALIGAQSKIEEGE